MAKIVEDAVPKQVRCESCDALIEYLPEDVQHMDLGDNCWSSSVKCPRPRCPGVGYPNKRR